mgnify:FL=1|jgi:hypothetical protein|tara:strand:+ start:87 stop:3398 length:3312 start_codon:yes stop_codon:yes gene_type:complete
MRDKKNLSNEVKRGDFPFPLAKGPEESRYTIWLRNHSNYMVTRGLLDYFRMAGVLLRGMLLNFMAILWLLLAVSLFISHIYGPQLRSKDGFTVGISPSQLETLTQKLRLKEREVDKWIVSYLSDETRLALEDGDIVLKDFDVTLSQVFRQVIDGELIYQQERFDGVNLTSGKTALIRALVSVHEKEAKNICLKGNPSHWAGLIESLSLSSSSCLQRLNRFLLEDAYPKINKVKTSDHKSPNQKTSFDNFDENETSIPCTKPNDKNKCLNDIWKTTLPGSGLVNSIGWAPPMPVPFTMSLWALLVALFCFLMSPIYVLFREIAGHKKNRERSISNGSVNLRDKFERLFGVALLVVLAFVLFEALPILVDQFHQFMVSPSLNWNEVFASMVGVSVVVLGGASKLISLFGGATKKLVTILIGLLGILMPLLVILYVTEFLVYAEPKEWLNYLNYLVPTVFLVLIGLVAFVGVRNKSLKRFEFYLLAGLATLGVIAVIAIRLLLNKALNVDPWTGMNFYFVLILMLEIYLFCWLVVDVNWTSIHSLYRDRLASAYLTGVDSKGDVAIEQDINLTDIGRYQNGSTAPYHLINVCLNLQGSNDPDIRDRASDFFIFSKKFIGGKRTGYCRTETMEQVHPKISLATAMAISAAAASPNMGRGTNPALVALMVLLNIRLGYWLPNPGLLEEILHENPIVRWFKKLVGKWEKIERTPGGFNFIDIFQQELIDIEERWKNVYQSGSDCRKLHSENDKTITTTTVEHDLVGVGFSGGGIRSATINLGITQALQERGVFDHIDYMSTVSGGGYLGSSISTLMRYKFEPTGEVVEKPESHMAYSKTSNESEVKLDKRHDTFWDRFRWRVPPRALLSEMLMKLSERQKWVNLSDGGHIENLAGIELLRRRCKFIIIGDGEADPELRFNGLATLIRYARIDLGISINIDPEAIRVDMSEDAVYRGKDNLSEEHCAFGTITYPPNGENGSKSEEGYLLYLKSSYSGDEDEIIKEYRYRNPTFPHQSTADQCFDENQFECYRALGQHIGEKACEELSIAHSSDLSLFNNFAEAMKTRAIVTMVSLQASLNEEKEKKELKWAESFGLFTEQLLRDSRKKKN